MELCPQRTKMVSSLSQGMIVDNRGSCQAKIPILLSHSLENLRTNPTPTLLVTHTPILPLLTRLYPVVRKVILHRPLPAFPFTHTYPPSIPSHYHPGVIRDQLTGE